jgi:hypothetical protein
MENALFVQANVAVNTKLTSKVPFLFENFQIKKKNWSKTCNFGKFLSPPPPRQHLREKLFSCPFQYPTVPLEAGEPPIFRCFLRPCLRQTNKSVLMEYPYIVSRDCSISVTISRKNTKIYPFETLFSRIKDLRLPLIVPCLPNSSKIGGINGSLHLAK